MHKSKKEISVPKVINNHMKQKFLLLIKLTGISV